MALLALTVTLLTSPADDVKMSTRRIGDSGLLMRLPETVKPTNPSPGRTVVTYDTNDLKLTVTITQTDEPPQPNQVYVQKVAAIREKLKKVTRVMNYPDLASGMVFGADSAMGVYLEGHGKGNICQFWSAIVADGFFYEFEAESTVAMLPAMESMVGSARLVDPKTGHHRLTPIDEIPLSVIGGAGFAPFEGAMVGVNASSQLLNANYVPCAAVAAAIDTSKLRMDDPDMLADTIRQEFVATGIYSRANMQVKKDDRGFTIEGTIPIDSTTSYRLSGRVYSKGDKAAWLVCLFDSADAEAAAFSKLMLETAEITDVVGDGSTVDSGDGS